MHISRLSCLVLTAAASSIALVQIHVSPLPDQNFQGHKARPGQLRRIETPSRIAHKILTSTSRSHYRKEC